jgi:hypothetical protein
VFPSHYRKYAVLKFAEIQYDAPMEPPIFVVSLKPKCESTVERFWILFVVRPSR